MRTLLACLLVVGLFQTPSAFAEDKTKYLLEKQTFKHKARWSIADWLDTRDQMRVQDLWLSLHSPSPFEFYADVTYTTGTLQTGANFGGWNITAAAYNQMFGLELQYQLSSLDPRWLFLGDLRIFGLYNQATNFTLQGGLRQELRTGMELWNPVAGANITLYIAKPVGVTGLYRHTFGGTTGISTTQDRFEVGAFIDFAFLRLHADLVVETTVTDATRSYNGLQVGGRFYF